VHFFQNLIFLNFDDFLCIFIEFAFTLDLYMDLLMICLLLFLVLHFCVFDFFLIFFDDFCWISLKLDFHFCGFSSDFFLVLGLGAWGLEPGLGLWFLP
jgi:hypothetical protein